MPNMGYCRFHNTLLDLRDCEDHIWDTDLSEEEDRARAGLVATCKRIVCDASGEDYDAEDDEEPQTEPIEMLRAAQGKLQEVIDTLREVARITGDRYYSAYITDHLEIMTSSNHGFVSRDTGLDEWIEELEKTRID